MVRVVSALVVRSSPIREHAIKAIKTFVQRWGCIPVLALTLAACGGGGGGGSPAAVVVPTAVRSGNASAGSDLTLANAGSFAGPMARAVMSSAEDSVPGVSGTRESPQSRTVRAALSSRWVGFALAA